jgi:hypothetical protein
MGKMLIIIGVVLIVAGVAMVLAGRAGLPLGRLPGDFTYRGKNLTVFFPLGTSILLSIILSLIVWLLGRGR